MTQDLHEAGFVVNLFLVYQFLRRLTTPFDETEAFKHGIIDERGKKLKKPKTKEEIDSYRMFDRMIFNLKKLIEKIPGGKTRIASYAAALFLIKEQENPTTHPDDLKKIAQYLTETMGRLEQNGKKDFRMMRDGLLTEAKKKKSQYEDAPTNAVGSGNIAGAAPGEDPPVGRKRRKKKDEHQGRKTFGQFMEFAVKKPFPGETLGIPRGKMPQIKGVDYPAFLEYLGDHGVSVRKISVPAKNLKAIQKEFSDAGVIKSIKKFLKKGDRKALIASKDMFIIDGHHRWLAALNTDGEVKIPIMQANVGIKKLFQLTLDFPKTKFKDIYE